MLVLKFLLISIIICIDAKPNFVFILTDDQDLRLNSMTVMDKTLELVGAKGKTFENAFVSSPICCPSRSTILTGKYAHNTGVVNNSISGNCSSVYWQQNSEPYSVANLLKKRGLHHVLRWKVSKRSKNRVMVRKRVEAKNTYRRATTGGSALEGNSKYYNYNISVNGTGVYHEDDYLTDLLADHSLDFLRNRDTSGPFFMTVATPAAHAPFTPANRHNDSFPDLKALRNPSFNYSSTDKHWLIQMPPKHLPEDVTILDNVYRNRQETLLAVDEMVERIVKKLEDLEILDETYIIFSSDNGFHIGQFTQPWDKREPYETDIRIPLLISGPGVPANVSDRHPFTAIDIAPTILDLAGISVPSYMDGTSLKDVLLSDEAGSIAKHIFVEYWGEGSPRTVEKSCPWEYDDENLAVSVL
ncbi:hypothetical protein NQ318_005700 [Aromia moschata]|uniref:Sulfatase N-terminal domain-containing protein n=1 Tax=Aromia moschata TaxID=1265417 RepID=A0AAV8XLA7_9CUCU|nr:hypothetical protein NQ318_005700 [Aromia moschata]